MSSQNNRLHRTKKKNRYVTYDGQTMWDNRNAGETPLSKDPDWMVVPKEVIARDHGPRKRKIKRQFMAPCPLTGNLVTCRELEGPVFCWESPGKGFLFGFTEDIDIQNVKVIDGGVGPD